MSKKDRRNETLKKQHTIPVPLFPSPSVGAWGHRNRKGEVTTTGAGAEFSSFAGNYASSMAPHHPEEEKPANGQAGEELPSRAQQRLQSQQSGIPTGPGTEYFAAS